MDLTIEIPQDASAVVIRAIRERSAKARAGELEYDSWKTDANAEYDSWSSAFSPRADRSRRTSRSRLQLAVPWPRSSVDEGETAGARRRQWTA